MRAVVSAALVVAAARNETQPELMTLAKKAYCCDFAFIGNDCLIGDVFASFAAPKRIAFWQQRKGVIDARALHGYIPVNFVRKLKGGKRKKNRDIFM